MRLPVVGIQVLLITTSTLRLAAAPSPPSVERLSARIGFAPRALRYSHVADLHDYSDGGPVGGPGYMAFLGKNRELRPHHDMYNNF